MSLSAVLLPLYIQSVMGYSATVSGLVTLPGSLASAIICPFAGRIYDKVGIKKLFVFGTIFLILSNVCMCTLTLHSPIYLAAIFNVIRCVCNGLMLMPMVTWGTSRVSKDVLADASVMLSSFRTISGSIGQAVFIGIMTAVTAGSAVTYGENAGIHGMSVAFMGMTAVSVIIFLIGIFLVKNKKKKD